LSLRQLQARHLGPAPAASFAPRVEALRAGLRELGYVQGRNLSFEFRWAETRHKMPELAAELVRAGVEVIFAPSSTETAAALQTTRTVPVVFTHADPVGMGMSRASRGRAAMPQG
jgi:putative ABC transport system substrate-binding protein